MKGKESIIPIAIPFEIPLLNGQRMPRSVWCYIVRGESAALIDASVAGAWNRIQEAIGVAGIQIGAIRHLVFTHAHPDHIGVAPALLRDIPATTYAHRDAVRWIEDTEAQKRERPVPGFDSLVEGSVRINRTLEDGEFLDLGGIRLQAIATPGHADGQLAFYCQEAEALFSGDALPEPNAMPIYTDLPATIRSLQRLRELTAVTALYSSWEEPIYERSFINTRFDIAFSWLQAVHDAVRGAVADGQADPAVITATAMTTLGLPPFAANPLTAATVRAHLKYADVPRIFDITFS
jgi:glyoxylase-like metal-dependent hydrolase (beta-lactamase superfamily II)